MAVALCSSATVLTPEAHSSPIRRSAGASSSSHSSTGDTPLPASRSTSSFADAFVAAAQCRVQPLDLVVPVPNLDGARRGAALAALREPVEVPALHPVALADLHGTQRTLAHPAVRGLVVHPQLAGGLRQLQGNLIRTLVHIQQSLV